MNEYLKRIMSSRRRQVLFLLGTLIALAVNPIVIEIDNQMFMWLTLIVTWICSGACIIFAIKKGDKL